MFQRMRNFKNYLTRKVKTQKKGWQRYFSSKGFGNKQYKSTEKTKSTEFSPLKKAVFPTTALFAFGMTDDEKKKDSEELKELLSQARQNDLGFFIISEEQLKKIEKLLKKHGYTAEKMSTLLGQDPQTAKTIKKLLPWIIQNEMIKALNFNIDDFLSSERAKLVKANAPNYEAVNPLLAIRLKNKILEEAKNFNIDLSDPLVIKAIVINSLSTEPSAHSILGGTHSRQLDAFKEIKRLTENNPHVLSPKTTMAPSSSMTSKAASKSLLKRLLNHFGWDY